MKGPNVTHTNGRYGYEFHGPPRGILILADPPEAGWRMRASSDDLAVCPERPAASNSACDADAQRCGSA
jgi:hypothetical protein